jgi:transcriptional regulator with XRE-family HTH domain
MPINLDDLLGIDNNDPDIIAAREDRAAYRALVGRLVTLRKSHGLTQAEVADAMETSQSVVSAFEQAGSDARFSTIQRYSRAVGARLRCWHIVEGGRPVQHFSVKQQASGADAFYMRSAAQ